FTPATGPRLLVEPQADGDRVREALAGGLIELGTALEASGVHLLFTLDEEAAFLERQGFARRTTHQFHWRNPGYATFDDFLGALRSEVRKQIKKERRRVEEAGVEIERVRGDRIDLDTWRLLFRIYRSTTDRKWGRPYLTEKFFLEAKDTVGS